MDVMDLLQRTDLTELATDRPDAANVSLFMPTHRFGSGVQADRIRWKNLLDGVESRLLDSGVRRPDVESLLAPAREVYEDTLDWEALSDGLVMFLRDGWYRLVRVPVDVPEIGVIGERFVVGPLLRVISDDEHFLLLTLSQSEVALWEGGRHQLDQVMVPDLPSDLRDVVPAPEPRSHTMARPGGRADRGGPAIFYGHGASDDQYKQDELVRFLRQVEAALSDVLRDQRLPLVLLGLEPALSTYRSVGGYSQVLDREVQRSPAGMSPDALHEAVWPVVEEHVREGIRSAESAFAAAHGTGLASADPVKVEAAAADGRVDTLFLPAGGGCWERQSDASPVIVRLGADDAFARCEALDRTAVETVRQGGRIVVVPSPTAPGGSDVAALFRY